MSDTGNEPSLWELMTRTGGYGDGGPVEPSEDVQASLLDGVDPPTVLITKGGWHCSPHRSRAMGLLEAVQEAPQRDDPRGA